MLSIYRKELRSYFITPVGYVFTACFLAASGVLFSLCTLFRQESSSVTDYFSFLFLLFAVLIPLLTMKLLSEERKTKTEQLLMTSPVSVFSIIFGKYLAALTVFGCSLLVNSLNFFLLYLYGSPNAKIILANILAIFLVGAAFIAVGLFLSALTENQVVAAVSSMIAIALMYISSYIAANINSEFIRVIVKWFSISDRYNAFTNGLLDIGAIVYFISFAAVFIVLTVRIYESRRWS